MAMNWRPSFSPKAFKGGLVLGHFARQEFQTDRAMKPRVLGLVDDAHTSATELFDDAIV
jgi:hypothetical protein